MVNELVMPIAIIAVTIAVAVLVLVKVKKWLALRDALMNEAFGAPKAANAAVAKQDENKRKAAA
jgi:hypothetical protein